MAAIPLSVPVRFESGAFGPCGGAVVAEAAGAKTSTTIRDNGAVLELDREENWRISLRDSGCWAAPVTIDSTRSIPDGGLVIHTWPKRLLRGTWRLPAGARAPKRLHVTLQSAPNAAAANLPEKVVEPCTSDGAEWRCEVPAAVLDLRLEAEGFAPVYVWERDLREKDADLGAIKLNPGASLAGWVVRTDGDSVGAEVELRPAAAAETAAVTQRLNAQASKVKTNARGFFQFGAVPAGMYTVTVKAEDMAVTRVEDVRIAEAREYALEAIRLQSLGRVEVALTPALTPRQGLWEVRLRPLGNKTTDLQPEVLAKHAVNEHGQWSRGGLEPGLYVLAVFDEAGSRVAERELDLRGQTESVNISIGEIQVSGRVRMGTKSVRASLRFESDGARVVMETDAGGAFTGTLPKEGTWRVQVSFTDVLQRLRVHRVNVKREGESVARVDIDLPGGVIEGRVVDDRGNGVAEAEVRVLRGPAAETNGATDKSGHFTLLGVQNGAVRIHALKNGLESEEVDYHVADSSTPVTLQLRDQVSIGGRVRMPNGSPVTGALIRYFYGSRTDEAISGPSGSFAFKVPRGLRSMVVVVLATGLPIKVDEVGIPSDGNGVDIRMEGI
ncbi:MAG TPA: carboxypeptidase-like regulatory domain-containing protein, partial [Thermoanaerobaculia bacterium]|nr:carboxypeptidase-like regulatory domain-containing protein [Thermoanaerobaculia bacterium]